MKILGKTESDDFIIQVSREEWELLKSGTKPLDDIDIRIKRLRDFPETEMGKIFVKNKGLRGKTQIRMLYSRGILKGTLDELRAIAEGTIPIDNLGDMSKQKIMVAINESL